MLDAIKELGDYVKKREGLGDIETFVDKAKLDKNTKHVLCIVFQHTERGFSYKGVIQEEYDPRKASLYLYRGGSSRGIDTLPSALITDKVEKTFRNKIARWFKDKDEALFRMIAEELEKNRDKIERKLIERYKGIPKEERRNVLITLKLEENGNKKYIGEIDVFKNILVQDTVRSYYFLDSIGESRGEGICYLCGNSGEIYGFVLPSLRSSGFGLSFSTADKRGFSPNFIQENHWKEIPICEYCARTLETGKRFLDDNLSFPKKGFNFFGCEYYVIPKIVFGELFDEFYDIVTYYKDKEYVDGLLSEEDYLEEIVKEKEDVVRLIFLFYTQKGGGKYIDIVRCVEDVLPSWIKELYDCQDSVKKMDIFREENMQKMVSKGWVGNFVDGLRLIGKDEDRKGLSKNNWFVKFTRDFFPSSKTEGTHDKYFMDVVSSILSRKPIDKDFMISAFVNRIRSAFKARKGRDLKILCLKAFMLYSFLAKVDLLRGERMEEGKALEKIEGENFDSKVERFFREHGFTGSAKKAAFSVGMLVDYLLWVQRDERGIKDFGKEPFWSNLYGLILDEKKIKGLFPKAISKLRQYGKGKPTLEAVVSKYLAEAEQSWDISNDEASYYFALGMTLGRLFSKDKEKEEEKKEGE